MDSLSQDFMVKAWVTVVCHDIYQGKLDTADYLTYYKHTYNQ